MDDETDTTADGGRSSGGPTFSPAELSDLREIEHLKYRYLRCVDLRLWDELAETLTPEVAATYGERMSFTGREAVVSGLRAAMTDDVVTEHHAHHPEITLSGDRASGRWYLQDRVLALRAHTVIVGAAFYDDTYARRDGRWLISRTGYTRTWEASLDLSDAPTFRMLDNHLTHR